MKKKNRTFPNVQVGRVESDRENAEKTVESTHGFTFSHVVVVSGLHRLGRRRRHHQQREHRRRGRGLYRGRGRQIQSELVQVLVLSSAQDSGCEKN